MFFFKCWYIYELDGYSVNKCLLLDELDDLECIALECTVRESPARECPAFDVLAYVDFVWENESGSAKCFFIKSACQYR